MNTATTPSLARQIAAAQAWWRDAGVDCDYTDEPVKWLHKEEPETADAPALARPQAAKPVAPPELAHPQIDRSNWPSNLADFAPWWLSEPSLDQGGLFPRIPPRGKANAAVMLIVQEPEEGDTETLLSGRQGALLQGMITAMGLSENDIYLASALPRHVPLADWDSFRHSGLGDLLSDHIALVAPQRVMLFGQQLPPLLGHDPAQSPASFDKIALQDGSLPALTARDLASLLNRPRWRADFWRRWLDWTGGAKS